MLLPPPLPSAPMASALSISPLSPSPVDPHPTQTSISSSTTCSSSPVMNCPLAAMVVGRMLFAISSVGNVIFLYSEDEVALSYIVRVGGRCIDIWLYKVYNEMMAQVIIKGDRGCSLWPARYEKVSVCIDRPCVHEILSLCTGLGSRWASVQLITPICHSPVVTLNLSPSLAHDCDEEDQYIAVDSVPSYSTVLCTFNSWCI